MISKPFIIALIVSISFNVLFGYLSYTFYSDKAIAESQLATAVKANKDLKESLDKKEAACKITDVIVSEYQIEKQEVVKETDGVLNAIDKMVSTPVLKTTPEIVPKKAANAAKGAAFNVESNVVNIDGELSDDLKRVLSQSCHSAKGNNCYYP